MVVLRLSFDLSCAIFAFLAFFGCIFESAGANFNFNSCSWQFRSQELLSALCTLLSASKYIRYQVALVFKLLYNKLLLVRGALLIDADSFLGSDAE
jgi:hypothetical protein